MIPKPRKTDFFCLNFKNQALILISQLTEHNSIMIKLLRAALFFATFLCMHASIAQWQVVDAPNTSTSFFNQLTFSSADIGYAIGNNGAILKTTDRGQSWQSLNSGTTKNLIGLFFVNDETGFIVGDSALVLATTDGGQTFATRAVPGGTLAPNISIKSVAFQPGSSTIGVFVAENGSILRTSNGGTNFILAVNTVGHTGGYSKVVFASNTLGFAVGDQGTIARTTNGGNNWTRNASLGNINLNDVQFIDASNGFIAGTGGLIRKTTNGGATWTAMNSYLSSSINAVHFRNASLGWAVGSNGRILKSGDGKNFASQAIDGENSYLSSVQFLSNNLGFAVGQGKILRHNDFSVTVNPNRLICGGNTSKVDTFTLLLPEGVGFFGNNEFKLSLWSALNFTGNKTLVKDLATIEANTSGLYTFSVDTLLKTDTITYFLQATSNSPTFQSTFFPVEVNLSVPNRPIIGNTDTVLCAFFPAYYGFAAVPKIKSYVWNFSNPDAGQIVQFGDSIRLNPNPTFTGVSQLSMNQFNACGISATSAVKNIRISSEPQTFVVGAHVVCSDSTKSRYRVLNSIQSSTNAGTTNGIVSWTMFSPILGSVGPVNGFNEASVRWTVPTLSGNTGFTVVARRRGECRNFLDTLRFPIQYRPTQDIEPSVSIIALQDSACPGDPFRVRALPLNSGNPVLSWYRDSVLIPNTAVANPALNGASPTSDPWALQTTMPPTVDSVNIYLILNSRLSCASRPEDTTETITIYRKRADDPNCLLVNSSPKVELKPAITYFPNPADNELNLVFSQFSKQDMQVQIFDQMGRDVTHLTTYSDQRSAERISVKFDIRQLKTGMYLIKAGNAGHQKLLRFIKR